MFIICSTGGLMPMPTVAYSDAEIQLVQTALLELPLVSAYSLAIAKAYVELIDTMREPESHTKYVATAAVRYMGCPRHGMPTLWVRLKEAVRVALGKPSRVYYTDVTGEVQDGMWSNAVRVELTGVQVREIAPHAYMSNQQAAYSLPLIKFIPNSLVGMVPTILTPFIAGE